MGADFVLCYGDNDNDKLAIGECSFLKAGMLDDRWEFIPPAIIAMSSMIAQKDVDGLTQLMSKEKLDPPRRCKINEDLIFDLCKLMELKNSTRYQIYVDAEDLEKFLRKGMGKEIYYETW